MLSVQLELEEEVEQSEERFSTRQGISRRACGRAAIENFNQDFLLDVNHNWAYE